MNIIFLVLILVLALYYIIVGIITSYSGYKIFKKAKMKINFGIILIYGLLWPIFIRYIIPGLKEIIIKDAVEKSVKETVEYIEKREEIKEQYFQQIMQQQNPGQLVGNSVTPENIEIPEDAIPIKEEKGNNYGK